MLVVICWNKSSGRRESVCCEFRGHVAELEAAEILASRKNTNTDVLSRLTPMGLNVSHLIRMVKQTLRACVLENNSLTSQLNPTLCHITIPNCFDDVGFSIEGTALTILNRTTQYCANLPQTPPCSSDSSNPL